MTNKITSNPETFAEKISQLFTLFHSGKHIIEASRLCTELISSHPTKSDPYHILGLIHARQRDSFKAIELINLAIQIAPENIAYKVNLANVLHDEKRYSDALDILDQTLLLSPHNTSALDLKGVILKDQCRYNEAEDTLILALKGSPDNPQIQFNLACVYQKNEKTAEAKLLYLRIIESANLKLRPVVNLASIYQSENEFYQAESLYLAALDTSEEADKEILNFNLGTLYHEVKKWPDAVRFLKKTLNANPSHFDAQNNLALCYWEMGEILIARHFFDEILTHREITGKARLNLCEVLQSTQSIDDWLQAVDDALSSSVCSRHERLKLYVVRSIIAWLSNDLIACQANLDKSVDLMTDDNKYAQNMRAYRQFLLALIKFKLNNLSLYQHNFTRHIYFIGDSHCLSANGLTLARKGCDYQIRSYLVIGAKAWHLSQDVNNRFKASVECAITKLEKGAYTLFGFGEIDCRINEGIFSYFIKHRNDRGYHLQKSIFQMVRKYVNYIITAAKVKELKVVFYGVPACVLTSKIKNINEADREKYLEVIELYNNALKCYTTKVDCLFLDIHSLTVGSSGFAKDGFHIDERHLSPSVFKKDFFEATNSVKFFSRV